ncbi:TPA: hypothetical protein ACGUW2_001584 [Vibrio vulnificus]|uniref:hypothetical protein n=2 Tax=Vibrio vulnificus TaxID=672 RepID=UPI001CCB6A85|nr:hypothetical protein [Vibrio vulnificus]
MSTLQATHNKRIGGWFSAALQASRQCGRYVAGENMEVLNQLFPSESQMERLKSSPESGEIHLLNLFKFREKAEYADGRDSKLTGKEAYELYGQPMLKVLEK